MGINVALDGPSGAGKSTIAKMAAKKLQYVYVDTGALYRSIAYYVISNDCDPKDEQRVVSMLNNIDVKLTYDGGAQHVMLNGEDVSDKIRTPEISMGASAVSAIPAVREFLFSLQQTIAKENNIIMDGRDIGTVVLPNADVKIFLTASAEERANRRFKELSEKGDSSTYDEVLQDIIQRDYNDTHREIAPLKKADDAVKLDSTELSLEEAVDAVLKIISDNVKKNDSGNSPKHNKLRELPKAEPVVRGKKLNPIRIFLYLVLQKIVVGIFKCYYKLSFEGKENLPKDGSNIFASNHRSYLDPILIAMAARVPCSYMAKEELFKQNAFFKWLITAFGAFPVTRGKGDTAAIDLSMEKLNMGRNLVIFPEGTRSKDGTVGRGKTGVALIAAMAQVPVIPVGINFEGKLKFRKKLVVRFGKPIDPEELNITSVNPRDLKALKTRIMDEIKKLVY